MLDCPLISNMSPLVYTVYRPIHTLGFSSAGAPQGFTKSDLRWVGRVESLCWVRRVSSRVSQATSRDTTRLTSRNRNSGPRLYTSGWGGWGALNWIIAYTKLGTDNFLRVTASSGKDYQVE